jgi:hypothetical protein
VSVICEQFMSLDWQCRVPGKYFVVVPRLNGRHSTMRMPNESMRAAAGKSRWLNEWAISMVRVVVKCPIRFQDSVFPVTIKPAQNRRTSLFPSLSPPNSSRKTTSRWPRPGASTCVRHQPDDYIVSFRLV